LRPYQDVPPTVNAERSPFVAATNSSSLLRRGASFASTVPSSPVAKCCTRHTQRLPSYERSHSATSAPATGSLVRASVSHTSASSPLAFRNSDVLETSTTSRALARPDRASRTYAPGASFVSSRSSAPPGRCSPVSFVSYAHATSFSWRVRSIVASHCEADSSPRPFPNATARATSTEYSARSTRARLRHESW
jgi:hypothetical protein